MQPDQFIARWQHQVGGQERANYGLFLRELCDVIGVTPPDPAGDVETNDYVFERVVHEPLRDGTVSLRRIDLYKRDSFVLEAKQSRQKGRDKELPGLDLPTPETGPRGRAGAERAWDVLMLNARKQAEAYVRHLPEGHAAPPFVIVCDVGHCFEIYANFRRDGKAYDQFPDRTNFRIYLEDLRKPEVRDTLAKVWADPHALDPARKSAQVTRAIAERLAAVSKAMEARKFDPQLVAGFLMRCLFTMFADSMKLLGEGPAFSAMLARCEADPSTFPHDLGQLWEAMDKGAYAHALRHEVPQFNGAFFKERAVLPLGCEEIGELRAAASHDWRAVEPAIFGTLLEQALDPGERRALGAHYTPRPYVERLVEATVMEPLRADWVRALSLADHAKGEDRPKDAVAAVQGFHDRLVATRVLDPACGTGNFLYVAMELMKRLEGEALEALANLGGQEALRGMESHVVNPRQFLGIEKNPRAAGIAELVLWIGHLQWHFRTGRTELGRPILHAYGNIECRDAVLLSDEREARGPDGRMLFRPGTDGQDVPVMEHRNPRRPAWLISAPFAGKLADKMGKLKLFTISAIVSLPLIFLITNMPAIPFYYVLVVTGLWFMAANARGVASSAMVSGVVSPEHRGSFMSLNSSIQQMCTGIAALAAGFIIVTDRATQKITHYPWVGYLSLLVIIICIFLGRKLGEGKE